MKKIIALVLALAMVAVLGLAFAEDTTITIPSTDTHRYSVYQIYTGDLDIDTETGVKTLSNVLYGKNAKNGAKGELVPKTELDAVAAITGTDAAKAAALAAYVNLNSEVFGTVTKDAALSVPTGYYFLKDADAIADNDEATLYILQVVGPTTIIRKAGTTTSDKTTDDHNDSETTADLNATGQSSSDYDIGDEVPYQVKATLSDNVELYEDFYKVQFQDTLEANRFSAISDLAIKVNGEAIAETENYTVTITGVDARSKDGFDVTIIFTPKEGKNLASLNNAVVTIDFTATLGEGAQIGGDGNSNTVKVIYSNNPNSDQEGETSPHEVKTFTFKVVINKIDGENKALDGAGFTLYKVLKADATAGVPDTDNGDAAHMNAYWATKAIATKVIAAEAGKTQFSFDGLDDGYYVLCETTTPSGYNTIDPQVFVISAEHDNSGITSLEGTHLDGSTITFTPDTSAGSLTAPIQNQSGTVLPSTGGIGTTIFYILGGLLVVGAAVILVARRKAQD